MNSIADHSVYKKINSLENLQIFMQYHVFAVWDFMSLLKSLQRHITCVELPWRDSIYDPKLVRLINEIVLGEESDVDEQGNPSSHFDLYLQSMEEIGASRENILSFIQDFDTARLDTELRKIVDFHLHLAKYGHVIEVAASFFFARENIIPLMFEKIVRVIESHELPCPKLNYYLKRHIELDGEEHGPLAKNCFESLVKTSADKALAERAKVQSLSMRESLWSLIEKKIQEREAVSNNSINESNKSFLHSYNI